MKRIAQLLLYGIYLVILCAFLTEILSRIYLREFVTILVHDERSLAYEYDSVLGWFPKKSSEKIYTGSRTIHVQHNRDGFRDTEHGPKERPRLLFLGDSFVWGYDVEQGERFTERLQEKRQDVEVLNFGVSGYGTDQELLVLEREYEKFKPDFVFLMFSSNDRRDNSSDSSYGFGKSYFVKEEGRLTLKGVPARKTAVYYLKKSPLFFKKSFLFNLVFLIYENLRKTRTLDITESLVKEVNSYLKNKGGKFVVGLIDPDKSLQSFCEKENISVLDFTSIDHRYRFPSYGRHWTPEGHERVSELIRSYLAEESLPFFSSARGIT